MVPLLACEGGNEGSGDDDPLGDQCLTETGAGVAILSIPDGEWLVPPEEEPTEEDWTEYGEVWTDLGEVGNDTITETVCGWNDTNGVSAHHCFTTAVHAVHMHTGELMIFHGEQDQRVWKIGTGPEEVEWHPNLLRVRKPDTNPDRADMFCSGHVQLGDGVMFAGGNITGAPGDGGLNATFFYNPAAGVHATNATADDCSFGWAGMADPVDSDFTVSTMPRMQHDRWYPTLTTLDDGRILIAAGRSYAAANEDNEPGAPSSPAIHSRLLEVYDPVANTMTSLDQPAAEFPVNQFPDYPQMFLLPNGDVFYAGSEEAGDLDASQGRIFVVDTAQDADTWHWSDHVVDTEIRGGSATMLKPGVILKTGGPALGSEPAATNRSECVDLSTYASGEYDDAPEAFTEVAPMNHARHYHNLVLLPNGNVLAVGGNTQDIGHTEESSNNPCDTELPGGQRTPIRNLECENDEGEGQCPSTCVDFGGIYDDGRSCGLTPSSMRCSAIGVVNCELDIDEFGSAAELGAAQNALCDAVLAGATCVFTGSDLKCGKECQSNADCGTLSATQCDGTLSDPAAPGMCNPGNNECYASKVAEIFDPVRDVWTEVGAQQFARMYHSTALLLPDGRVISMGGGHRQGMQENPISEYFAPQYTNDPSAPRPIIEWGDSGDFSSGIKPLLVYGNFKSVSVAGPTPRRFTLLRLAATTHGFDQDARFVELDFQGSNGEYMLEIPESDAILPRGYYMLFAISNEGQPSIGEYVKVGDLP